MPRVLPTLDFIDVMPNVTSLKRFALALRTKYEQLARVVNGQINFGDGTNRDNVDGAWVSITTPVAPNTDFTVTHNLQRVPVGYWIMKKAAACDVYTGSVAATSTQLTLRATVGSVNLVLFVV